MLGEYISIRSELNTQSTENSLRWQDGQKKLEGNNLRESHFSACHFRFADLHCNTIPFIPSRMAFQ